MENKKPLSRKKISSLKEFAKDQDMALVRAHNPDYERRSGIMYLTRTLDQGQYEYGISNNIEHALQQPKCVMEEIIKSLQHKGNMIFDNLQII